jgi:hypothetical protein
VEDFVPEIIDFLSTEGMLTSDIFVVGWILGNESSFLQEREMIHEAFLLCKYLNILKKDRVGNACQRVLDPVDGQRCSICVESDMLDAMDTQ